MDPELEGLLREAARDPRSTLFRRTPRQPIRRLALVDQPVRSSATGLSALDRHLLDVWRHELAGILYDTALTEFAMGQGRGRINLHRDIDHAYELGTPAVARAKLASNLAEGLLQDLSSRSWLDDWVHRGRVPEIAQLLNLAHSLRPQARTILLGANASTVAGDLDAAELELRAVLEQRPDRITRQRVHEALGLVLDGRGDLAGAARAMRVAHGLEPERGTPVLSWFSYTLVLGEPEEARLAAREVERSIPPNSEILKGFVSNLHILASGPGIGMSERARLAVSHVTSTLGPVSGSIYEVVAQ
jgi:hypothetical protein